MLIGLAKMLTGLTKNIDRIGIVSVIRIDQNVVKTDHARHKTISASLVVANDQTVGHWTSHRI